jgi:hypothetical protein
MKSTSEKREYSNIKPIRMRAIYTACILIDHIGLSAAVLFPRTRLRQEAGSTPERGM